MSILKNGTVDKIYLKLETIFKYFILILTLFSFNSFFANNKYLTLASTGVAALGAVLLLYRFVNLKKYIKFYGFIVLIAFVFAYLISSVVQMKYGITGNIKTMIWSAFQFGILYALDYNGDIKKERKDYFGLLTVFNVYVFINNVISIIMLVTGYGKTPAVSFNKNIIGFVWGRLWGSYYDPNNGAVFCVAAIAISVYFAIKTDKVWQKILYAIHIFISLAYIAFSDSRTGLVCLGASLITLAFLLLRSSEKNKLKTGMKNATSLVLAGVIAVVGVISIPTITKTYNAIATSVKETNQSSTPVQQEQSNDPGVIGREDDQVEKDISNRRFSLWGSGIEIWKTTPIFGTTQRNITPYTLENLPDTYMVNNDKGGHFDTTHNTYIDILVCQGILGAVIFLVFLAMVVILVARKMLFTKDYKLCNSENILMITLVVNFAVSCVFILDVVYMNTAAAVLFWLTLGRLVKNLRMDDGKAK